MCLTLLGGIVVPASKLSPDADMIVDERTTYKSKLYIRWDITGQFYSLKQEIKPDLRCLNSRRLWFKAGGKEATCVCGDQLVKIQILKM